MNSTSYIHLKNITQDARNKSHRFKITLRDLICDALVGHTFRDRVGPMSRIEYDVFHNAIFAQAFFSMHTVMMTTRFYALDKIKQ